MHHPTFLLPTLLSAALAAGMALIPAVVHADPPRVPSVSCTGGGLSSPAKFTQISPGRAEYNFSGVCTRHDGRSFGYRAIATWTPSETNPVNANASEIYRIDALSGPSQSYDVVVGARCASDPWLNSVNCANVGDNIPDDLRELWPDFADSPFPYSRRGIPYDQRAALLAEYERANGKSAISQSPIGRLRRTDSGRYGSPAVRHDGSVARPIDAVALNPQPLPPRSPDAQLTRSARSRVDEVSLNPQPLPPRSPDARLTRSARSRVDQVSLNPQPLPPGPPDAQMAQSSRATQSGIIIVSGKQLRLRADTLPATDAPAH